MEARRKTRAKRPMPAAPSYPYPLHHCTDCGAPYWAIQPDQRFCSPVCRRHWHGRAQVRGAQVYHMLYLWRRHRGKADGPSLSEITRVVDRWLAEDKSAGRDLAQYDRSVK